MFFFITQRKMGATQSVTEKSIHEFTVKVIFFSFFFFSFNSIRKTHYFLFFRQLNFSLKVPFLLLWELVQDAKGKDVDLSKHKGKVLNLWLRLLPNGSS